MAERRTLVTEARAVLPRGRSLPEGVWELRHRGVLVLLWAHAVAIPIYALVRGFEPTHVLAESAIVPISAYVAGLPVLNRRLRTGAASFGLLTCSAVLVHLSGGLIEMHFHFFVMVAVVALYQDWIPFLAAVGYVLVHHGVLGALAPESVFNHPAALNHPWRWAGVHALFVSGISAVCLVTWRLNEVILAHQRRAEERLRAETHLVETLNDVGRSLAAELDLRSVLQHVTDACTSLTSARFGAFFYNVVDDAGETYLLYTLSGVSEDAFAGFPMPRNTPLFAATFSGLSVVRLDDVRDDPRYGRVPPHHGMPDGHLEVRSYLAVPVRSARGEVLGGLFFGHPEVGRFTESDERIVVGIAAHAAVAIDNAKLYESERQAREEAEEAQRRLLLLAEASRVLASSLELDRVLAGLTRIVVPALGDTCVIYLRGDDEHIHQVAAASALADNVHVMPPFPLSETANPVVDTVTTGRTSFFGDVSDELLSSAVREERHLQAIRELAPTSAIVVPLPSRGQVLGAFAVGTLAATGRRMTADDVAVTEELGRRAAIAVENARLYAAQRTAAETLQHSLLPAELPDLPGVDLAGRYLPGGPAVDIGGDWYDVLPLPDGRVGLAMGDVVGRGIPAASLMGQLRNGLRAFAVGGSGPAEVLTQLNGLIDEVQESQMATLIYLVFDCETGEARFANAGHPPPLLVDESGARYLEGAVGVPLGALTTAQYRDETVTLSPGAALLLYTDGLVEARDSTLDDGLTWLLTQARDHPGDISSLCDVLVKQRCQEETHDDVALLAMQWMTLGRHLTMHLPTRPSVLGPVRAALRRWLSDLGMSEQESYEILVATCEACTNAIRHGRPLASHFDLEADADGRLEIVVRSDGAWREPRPTSGGRGLEIMRQFMDHAEVNVDGDVTEVVLVRALAGVGDKR